LVYILLLYEWIPCLEVGLICSVKHWQVMET